MFKNSISILMSLFSTNLYAHVVPGVVHAHPHGAEGYYSILLLIVLIVAAVGVRLLRLRSQ